MKYTCFLLTAVLLLALQIDADCQQEIKTYYSCYGGSIEDLDKVPDNVQWMVIEKMTVGRITEALFRRFGSTLQKLECRDCQITDIDDDAFSELGNLEFLTLRGNYLPKLKVAWFKDAVNLTDLYLSINGIEKIEDYAFSRLTNLFSLQLVGNNLTEVKANWFGDAAVPLQHFSLSYNKINRIENNAFGSLPKLDNFDIEYNNLSEVKSQWFGNTVPVKKLYLRKNKIQNFDSELIDKAVNLTFLDVSENRLECHDINRIATRLRSPAKIIIKRNLYSSCISELEKLAEKNDIKLEMD